MRSSESANIAITSTWLPKVMRSGKIKSTAMAASHGSVSARRKRWRLSRYSAARSRASERVAEVMASLAAIEPRRLDQKNGNRHRVDEKSTGIGEQILSGRIEHAEHERRQQRALQAAQPADRDHDQEQHKVENSKAWREAEQ